MSTVRLYKRGKHWYVDYAVNGKRIRKSVSTNKQRASLIAATIQSNLEKEKYGLPLDIMEIPLRDLAAEFMHSKKNRIAPKTSTRYNEYLNHFITFVEDNFPASTECHQVREVYVEECLDSIIEGGGATKTANNELAVIKQFYNFAVKKRYTLINPAKDIKNFPAQPSRIIEYYTEEEMNAIIENSTGKWSDIFEFLYLTGLRNAELINLAWDNVNLERKQITIQSDANWRTKTRNARVIPLHEKAVGIIERCQQYDDHNYVFTNDNGKKIHNQHPRVVLQKVLKKLGIVGNIHKIRHTFASHLVMKGTPLYDVGKLLGHTSTDMTQKYAHLAPGHLKKTVDRL